MTVLVTGGAGYIGSHMVHALLEAGDQVVVLDNLTTGFDWAVPPGATLIAGDAGDQSRVSALIAAHRIDAIIHFAASIVVPDSVRDPLGQLPRPGRGRGQSRGALFHLLLDRGGLRQRVPVREDDPRLFGAGRNRHRQACCGRRLQGRARTAAGGRPDTNRGSLRPSPFRARMAAAL